MSKELLKLALEAIERGVKDGYWNKDTVDASTRIQKYLADQPAQQEPVAWMYPDDYERMTTSETFCTVYSVEVGSATRGETTVALYTSPPSLSLAQRTWVGLTTQEVQEIHDTYHKRMGPQEFAQSIEAKLKEKNT